MSGPLAILVVLSAAASGLVAPNLLHDLGSKPGVARFAGGAIGGLAYLLAVLLLEPIPAIVLSASATILVVLLRLRFKDGLRGVAAGSSGGRYAEVTFLATATLSLSAGWGLLGSPAVAFVPIAFVAWGDNLAGLVRALTGARLAPAVAMLVACLAVALPVLGLALAALAALVATGLETARPPLPRPLDDNVLIVGSSLYLLAALGAG